MRHLRSEAGDCELGELWRVVTEAAVDQDARPPLNAHLRTRGGQMRRLNTPLSDCRVYSWALLSVTDAK